MIVSILMENIIAQEYICFAAGQAEWGTGHGAIPQGLCDYVHGTCVGRRYQRPIHWPVR